MLFQAKLPQRSPRSFNLSLKWSHTAVSLHRPVPCCTRSCCRHRSLHHERHILPRPRPAPHTCRGATPSHRAAQSRLGRAAEVVAARGGVYAGASPTACAAPGRAVIYTRASRPALGCALVRGLTCRRFRCTNTPQHTEMPAVGSLY